MILSIDHIKESITTYFANKPVKKVWLFGSYARGEANENSDIDVLMDVDYDINVGFDYYIWPSELSKLFKVKVDMVSLAGLSKFLKPVIDKDKTLIYEKT